MGRFLKVTVSGAKFVVETEGGRLHILGEKALKWNLKHVFGLDGLEVLAIMACLDSDGSICFNVETLEKISQRSAA